MPSLNDPPLVAPVAPEPVAELARGSCIGRYLLLDPLGQGGMGVVYKAYDPELDRPIALKLLRAEEASASAQRDRLLREAQALARLSHPNVIAVHDVGTFGDDVFIAMEFVEGQTVRQWLQEQPRTQRQILEVFLAAGEGLAAAHRVGLVHRDFKPDNVMVGNDGRVRVLDFGLARAAHAEGGDGEGVATERPALRMDEAAPTVQSGGRAVAVAPPFVTAPQAASASSPADSGTHRPPSQSGRLLSSPLTRFGAIIGTPRFMSPEQHQGRPIEASSDQFSFCVSLYWALYGKFPFSGATEALTIDNVISGRVDEPPADASVPRWLRQVLLRGLGRAPSARFASMAALLVALRADPLAARWRWLRAALLVLLASAVVAAAVVGLLAYKLQQRVVEQARLAQQFGQEVERIAAISRYAASLPLHDTRRERDAIRERMERLRARMRTLGPVAQGPGHEALGRGYLALERYDEALAELEASRATGYRSPELAFALGLVHGKLYERALADLVKTSDEKLDAARRAEIARKDRDPALRYLKEVGAVGVDAPEYVEGLIALYEQRFAQALALAQKTATRVLWLYEARTLEGDIHLMDGKERYWTGDIDGAVAANERAGAAYRSAAEAARSGFAAHEGECRRLLELTIIQVDRDQSPEATVKQTLAACAAAATVRPDDGSPIATQARAWQHLGNYQARHAVNPAASEREAIRLAEQALTLAPREIGAHYVLGWAYLTEGEYTADKGGDPRVVLAKGVEHGRRTVEIDPTYSQGYALLCHLYNARGDYELVRGIDPRASYRAAAEQAQKAIDTAPTSFHAWNALGISVQAIAAWETTHGADPTDALVRAVDAYDHVVKLSPTLDYGHINVCESHLTWAQYDRRRGSDPRARLERAIATCKQAIKLDGNYSGSHLNLGVSYATWAAWQLEHAIDPTAMIAQSRAELLRTLEIDHGYQLALVALGDLGALEGRAAQRSGRDPEAAFAEGEARARRAFALSGDKSAEALAALAELSRRRAEWRAERHLPVEAEVRQGLALAARALEQNATLAPAAAAAGALELVAARTASRPTERAAAAAAARVALDKALGIDANLGHEYAPLRDEAIRLTRP